MATHPPLIERIKRLDPQFDGDFKKISALAAPKAETETAMAGFTSGAPSRKIALKPGDVISRVGVPTPAHLAYAASIMTGLPPDLNGLMRETAGACAVIYALLLSKDEAVRAAQTAALGRHADQELSKRMKTVLPLLGEIKPEARLAVADVAVSSLKQLSKEDYARFSANLAELVGADKEIDLFEYALQRMVTRRLAPLFGNMRPPKVEHHDLAPLMPAAAKLLSCLAYWGADEMPAAQRAFAAGAGALGKGTLQMLPVDDCGLPALDETLTRFNLASPAIKRTVISACTACIAADGEVTSEEAQIVRAVADALDCPIPPFLPGQKV